MQLYKDFIPTNSISYVEDLLKLYQTEIKVKSERRTRHGDFRVLSNGNCLITVNSNLNKYRFLITLIHEITHLYVYKIFKLEKKLRKRYKCLEIETGKYYLFNANAEINITN